MSGVSVFIEVVAVGKKRFDRADAPSVILKGASRSQVRDYRPPFGRVVAGSLRCGVTRVSRVHAPKLRVESRLGRAEFHVPVSPKSINTVGIPATGMGHGTPGVNQVGHHRPLRG